MSNAENDERGWQNIAYKIIKHLNKGEKDGSNLELLKRKGWIDFCKKLWYSKDEGGNGVVTPSS